MSADELQIPDLVAFALYEADERAAQFHLPLQMFLATLALHQAGEPLSEPDLYAAVCGLLPTRDLTAHEFAATVEEGLRSGFVERGDGEKLMLGDARRAELQEAEARLIAHREAFHEQIQLAVEKELGEGLDEDRRDALRSALEIYLQRLFQAQSVALAEAFRAGGGGFDASMDAVAAKKLTTLVNSLVPASEKLRRAQYQVGIRDGLLNLDEHGRAHLAALYEKTVAFALLHQDPGVQRVKRRLAKDRMVYLDTNVVMAWMFEDHRFHTLASEVIELAAAVHCTVRVSRFTLDELELQLQESDQKYQRISQWEKALAVVDDDVIRTFQRRKDAQQALSWSAYLANYKPATAWLRDHNVVCDEQMDWANAVHDQRKPQVQEAISNAKHKVPPQLIDFDAHNLLYIQLRRVGWRPDEMGNRVWLVTLDRSLRRAETELVRSRVFPVPSSIEATSWCDLLSAYVTPESGELEDYVAHLVQSQLGLLGEDPKFVDTNFLLTLDQSNFDIRELLNAGPERVRQVLVGLQEDREVKRLLTDEEARRKKPAWSRKLDAAVGKALQRIEPDAALQTSLTQTERQRDKALQAADEAKRERDLALRKLAELGQTQSRLEERLKKLEEESARREGGVLRRLLDALRNGPSR